MLIKVIRLKSFTLVEVLITLTIIGIVAALTIPQLVKNMSDYEFSKAQSVTLAKIKEATNQMKSNDVLAGYATNELFADEFQKYMKVVRRCDSSTLTKCFPAKFKTNDGTEIDTATLTAGTALGPTNSSAPTVGLGLVNGTAIILALKPVANAACDRIDPTDNTSDTASCLSFLYDVNGFASPNVVGKDIGAINVDLSASTCSGFKAGAVCISAANVSIVPISEDPYNSSNNYWAGAEKACSDIGMRLPTLAEKDIIIANKASLTGLSGYYWSAVEFNAPQGAIMWNSADGGQGWDYRNVSIYKARCVK